MTTRAEMATMAAQNAETAECLYRIGTRPAMIAAAALIECTSERQTARGRWPRVCGRITCAHCIKPLLGGWERGMTTWARLTPSSTTIMFALNYKPGEIKQAVRVARRALRDLRDRRARRFDGRPWRDVMCTGLVGADGLRLHVRHPGIGAAGVLSMIQRRWPSAQIVPAGISLSLAFSPEDRASLALLYRGAEPIRVMVMPQGCRPRLLRDFGIDIEQNIDDPSDHDHLPMPFLF